MDVVTYFIALIIFLFQVSSALHALFYKKDPREAWVWIIVCLMLPPIGPILYFLFGINRVKLKAKKISFAKSWIEKFLKWRQYYILCG